MITVEEAWLDFERITVHPDASSIQRCDVRDAFWAGATALLGMVGDITETCEHGAVLDPRAMSAIVAEVESWVEARIAQVEAQK